MDLKQTARLLDEITHEAILRWEASLATIKRDFPGNSLNQRIQNKIDHCILVRLSIDEMAQASVNTLKQYEEPLDEMDPRV